MEEDEESAGETEVIEGEQMALYYRRKHSSYLYDPRLKRLRHSTVVEQTNHFWLEALPFDNIHSQLSYNAPDNIKSTHQ